MSEEKTKIDSMPVVNLYDGINSLAVKILTYNYKRRGADLGVINFNPKNKTHLWFIKSLDNFRVFNGYPKYYLQCNFFIYFYYRFIKKMKYIRWATVKAQKNIFLIDPKVFAEEVCRLYQKDGSIVEKIYDEYWS